MKKREPKRRNAHAEAALARKAGPMKDRRKRRQGNRAQRRAKAIAESE